MYQKIVFTGNKALWNCARQKMESNAKAKVKWVWGKNKEYIKLKAAHKNRAYVFAVVLKEEKDIAPYAGKLGFYTVTEFLDRICVPDNTGLVMGF